MRRVLLIFLSLVLALVSWNTVCADDGFYVIPAMRGKYAPVPKTGQTIPYGTNDDGTLKKGVPSPTPRFTDNGNGTVTDNLTGLIWQKDAGTLGAKNWADALTTANTLKAGYGGLVDGSEAGDWRLPNLRELQSLVDYSSYNPPLPTGHPFINVQLDSYWSSVTRAQVTSNAWTVWFVDGGVYIGTMDTSNYVWCVRGGP